MWGFNGTDAGRSPPIFGVNFSLFCAFCHEQFPGLSAKAQGIA
jgi:hypothetical protein